MNNGYIKLYRKITEAWFYKDSEAVHLWIHLLSKARHKDGEFMFNLKRVKLKKGQILTGRKTLAGDTGINESKVKRLLACFKDEELIDQHPTSRYSVITIKNWEQYQQSDQLVTSQRPASDHKQECKNEKNENKLSAFESWNWKEDETFIKWCKAFKEKNPSFNGFNESFIEEKIEELCDYCRSKGKSYKDYQSALKNWIRNEAKNCHT